METISTQTEALWNKELSVIVCPELQNKIKLFFIQRYITLSCCPEVYLKMENTEVRLMEKYIRVLALQTILYGTHSERPILCSYY